MSEAHASKLKEIESQQGKLNDASVKHKEVTQKLTDLISENGFTVLLASVVGLKHK